MGRTMLLRLPGVEHERLPGPAPAGEAQVALHEELDELGVELPLLADLPDGAPRHQPFTISRTRRSRMSSTMRRAGDLHDAGADARDRVQAEVLGEQADGARGVVLHADHRVGDRAVRPGDQDAELVHLGRGLGVHPDRLDVALHEDQVGSRAGGGCRPSRRRRPPTPGGRPRGGPPGGEKPQTSPAAATTSGRRRLRWAVAGAAALAARVLGPALGHGSAGLGEDLVADDLAATARIISGGTLLPSRVQPSL